MILSARAVYIANAVKRAAQGALHLVIAENKKEAYYLASDLDNFFREENLFFFPATSEKSEYKKNTALLQRTATLYMPLTRHRSLHKAPAHPRFRQFPPECLIPAFAL